MIACPNCRTIQPRGMLNSGELRNCPRCGAQLRVDLFSAFFQPLLQGRPGQSVQEPGQAECYDHPGRQAVAPCALCGRLMCTLCEVELEGRKLCFTCLQAGRHKEGLALLEHQRTLYDSIALALAFIPMLMVFPTLLTAPAAIYMAIRYWKRPCSILPRMRWRFLLAVLLAGGQVAGWAVFFTGVLS